MGVWINKVFVLLTVIAGLSALPAYAISVRVQIIDVGQGDGIVIRTPSKNDWVVIDQLSEYLVNMGVDNLDMAIVTQRHFDHHGGMDDVLKAVSTDLYVGITEDCPNRSIDDKVRQVIEDKSIPIPPLSNSPEEILIDGVTFTLLPLPPRSDSPEHENLNSVVVRIDYGEFSMLFTGDAENEELDWLVANHSDLLDVDVLKASHHGSNNGLTNEFLDAVSPDKVVISAGVHKPMAIQWLMRLQLI